MKRVVIESPYAGDVEANVEYARRCLLDSLNRGEAPIASHLLHTQVIDDDVPSLRDMGVLAGHAWIRAADFVAVYCDRGVSPGMHLGINYANNAGVRVVFRNID